MTHWFHHPFGSWGSSLSMVLFLVLTLFQRPVDLAAAPMVTLQAQVILASNQPGAVPDPPPAELIAQLRKALPYRSFQLLSSPSGRAILGQSCRAELPGAGAPGDRILVCRSGAPGAEVPRGRMLELTPTAIDRGAIRVQARVVQSKIVQGRPVPEALVDSTLLLHSGGPPVVIGGPAHLNGVLVIVISASIP